MHGLASYFVYVATIVLVYACVSLFLYVHTTHLFFKVKYFINELSQLFQTFRD